MTPSETAHSPASRAIHAAWLCRHDRAEVNRLLQPMTVPGAVALRARYRHLGDVAGGVPADDSAPSWDDWVQIIELETAGDEALVRAPADASTVFRRLLDLEPSTTLRIVTANALQGLGDAARQSDDLEAAAELLTLALDVATADGYRFGRLRAFVSLGYLAMTFRSAGDAGEFFGAAAELARDIPDPLYGANAQLGSAEVALRTGNPDKARQRAALALAAFEALGSPVGAGNAAERLAGACRALNDMPAAAAALNRAADHFHAAGAVIGEANVLDALGEIHLGDGDLSAAREAFQRAIMAADEHGYRRGTLNSTQGLARTERADRNWSAAATLHRTTLEGYEELGDLVGQMHSYDGLAYCARHTAGTTAELTVRIESVQALERLRASRPDHRVQTEYRARFLGMYRAAMRTALEADSAASALFIFECLAGRRLAGLVEGTPHPAAGDAELAAHVVALADQRLSRRTRPPGDRRERALRTLGATAVRHGLADRARDELEDLAASLFLPLDPAEAEDLLQAVPADCHVLVLAVDATVPGEVAFLWRRPSGDVQIGRHALGTDVVALMNQLITEPHHYPSIGQLAPLQALLQPDLRESLASSEAPPRLLLVPVGGLWNLPWPAISLTDDRVLGEVVELCVCPSLTVHRSVSRRSAVGGSTDTSLWRNPTIAAHRYPLTTALGGTARWITSETEARASLLANPGGRTVVIGHGRPTDGGVYLELEPGSVITVAELLSAQPPSRLALVCCWGLASREAAGSEPLTLGVVAMLAGAEEVLATTAELADSMEATMFLRAILSSNASSLAAATRDATSAILSRPGFRELPVAHWAPVVTLSAVKGHP